MIEYRRITAADVGLVAQLARQAAEGSRDLPLHIDFGKIRAAVQFFADEPGHFQLAAFRDGVPVAAVAAHVAEMPFFERHEAQIVMCFSTDAGAGVRLLRALVAWFKDDMRIRRVVWCMNEGADRVAALMSRRFGFTHRLETCVLYK